MAFPEEIQRIDARRSPIYRQESDAMRIVKQKIGESLARHGHRRQESVRPAVEPNSPKVVGKLAIRYALHDEIIDTVFGNGASRELGPYFH